MSEVHCTDASVRRSANIGKALKRRGILAAAGAVVAGIAARQVSQPVGAVAYPLQGDTTNNAAATTTITGAVGAAPILQLTNTGLQGVGVAGSGIIGVTGNSTSNSGVDGTGPTGVRGFASGAGGTGVFGMGTVGVNGQGSGNAGVYGSSDIVGVTGRSSSTGVNSVGVSGQSSGIYGVSGRSDAAGGVGVSGACTGGYGVLGTVSDGYGVFGQANTGNGVRGFSSQNHAIVGQTGRAYFGGVFGTATIANTVGIYGSTYLPSIATNVTTAYAGYMDGNFVVANGVKSAAVPHKDGTHRLVYCVESPESWLEDFGEAKLVNGRADVKLDPDFAAVVDTSAYHVFLTTYGEQGNGLNVAQRRADGFSVVERNKGASSLTFSYRIVARRKDIKAERLAKFELVGREKHDAKPPQLPPSPTIPNALPDQKR